MRKSAELKALIQISLVLTTLMSSIPALADARADFDQAAQADRQRKIMEQVRENLDRQGDHSMDVEVTRGKTEYDTGCDLRYLGPPSWGMSFCLPTSPVEDATSHYAKTPTEICRFMTFPDDATIEDWECKDLVSPQVERQSLQGVGG